MSMLKRHFGTASLVLPLALAAQAAALVAPVFAQNKWTWSVDGSTKRSAVPSEGRLAVSIAKNIREVTDRSSKVITGTSSGRLVVDITDYGKLRVLLELGDLHIALPEDDDL